MLQGSDIIRLARCFNGIRHHNGGAPEVNAELLRIVGEDFNMLMDVQPRDLFQCWAIIVCRISRKREDGIAPVFKSCSTHTAAFLLGSMLYTDGFRKKGSLSEEDRSQLREAFEGGDWQIVSKLYKKIWKKPS